MPIVGCGAGIVPLKFESSKMEQWLKDNWVLVTGIGFAGSIIYLAAVFGKA
jgi:hypothetical protein